MPIPKIQITDEAMGMMADEVIEYGLTDETALAIAGLIYPDRVVINGVVRPIHSEILRENVHVTIGGETLGDTMEWWHMNWLLEQKYATAPTDVRFSFLFYGHKHPGWYSEYSPTDMASMRRHVEEGLEYAIGPLFTVEEYGHMGKSFRKKDGALTVIRRKKIWMRFYFLSREMADEAKAKDQIPEPILVTPEIVSAASVPTLPKLSWHLSNPLHYREQMRHMRDSHGCKVLTFTRDVVKGPPYEFVLFVSHPEWKDGTSLIITTSWDFPASKPTFQLVTTQGLKTLTDNETKWSPEMDFIEVILKLEKDGVLK